MKARPFILVAAAVLASVESRARQALQAWADDWGVPADALTVHAQRAYECVLPTLADGWCRFHSQAGEAYLGWHPDSAVALHKLVFAPDMPPVAQAPVLAPAAGRQAREDLGTALAGILFPQAGGAGTSAAPPAGLSVRGAGAVVLAIGIGRQQSWLLLDDACVHALRGHVAAPALPPLARVDYQDALGTTPVALDLTVGSARVGLGSLMTLAVGDVIRLDTPVEQPITLSLPGGSPLLNGYMGLAGSQVAVELTRSN